MTLCPNCSTPLPPGSAECENCATAAFGAVRTLSDTPHISGYDVLRRIGEGGMGSVYLAEERALGRRVAIKIVSGRMATDPQMHARFLREARSLATIEHANVVRIYAFGEVDGLPYLTMEFVDGQTLSDRIRLAGRLSVEESVRLMRQVLLALEAAWEKGIVHRDIKPSNILLDARGQVHVADFGLAKPTQLAEDPVLTQSGSVLGTPYYVSPEQAQGLPTDFRSDIYSCGILFYEMLTGARPFEGTTPLAIVAKHLNEPMPPIRSARADIPGRVARLIDVMTEKRPERRPQSYAELIGMFDALLGLTPSQGIAQTQTLTASTPMMWLRGRGASARVIGAVAAVAVLLAVLFFVMKPFGPRGGEQKAATARPAGQFVVAVAPFYGPDPDSAKEGRMMAALIERSITTKLGSGSVRVAGIDETKDPVHSHDAARALGERLGASVVVWGEAFALKQETEIQPYFTLVQKKEEQASDDEGQAAAVKVADPLAALAEQSTGVTRVESQAPNQIELRKTSAEGVGEMVTFLAALHAFYERSDPQRALALLEHAPHTIDVLRLRGRVNEHLARKDDGSQRKGAEKLAAEHRQAAALAFEEALAIDATDVQTRADLADVYLRLDRFPEAAAEYRKVAATGKPYTTAYGIAAGEFIYIREMFRAAINSGGMLVDTGYVLAANPSDGVIARRHHLPGVIHAFEPRQNGFVVRYAADREGKQIETATFEKDRFTQPLTWPVDLRLRMRGEIKAGAALAEQFTTEFTGLVESQKAHPRFVPAEKMPPEGPQTIAELEAAERRAVAHDPTQPWHLFYLGEALWAQGKRAEAEAVWKPILTRDFGVSYVTYNFMSKPFERLGQHDWADRVVARGTRERLLMPQPVQFTLLIDRLVSVAYMRLHPEDAKDLDRAHRWFVQAREISGPTEFDNFYAGAWAAHFRRSGDVARARAEEQFLNVAAMHPLNAIYTRHDYAVDAFVVALFAFVAGSFLLVLRSLLRVRAAGVRSDAPKPRLLTKLLMVAAFAFAGFVLGFTMSDRTAAFLLIVGFGSAVLVGLRSGGTLVGAAIADVSRSERAVVGISFILLVLASAAVLVTSAAVLKLQAMPVGTADSLGHPWIVNLLEKAASKSDAPATLYTTAVANQLGGNVERARQLYQRLPDDDRARRALAALDGARPAIIMPTDDELIRAFAWTQSVLPLLRPEPERGTYLAPVIPMFFAALLAVLLTIAFVTIAPAAAQTPNVAPARPWRRRAAQMLFLLFPGVYDVTRRSAARGFATLGLFAFTLFVIVTTWLVWPDIWVTHYSADFSRPGLAAPLPPGVRAWDTMFAFAYSRIYWSAALLAVLATVVLHAQRIREIVSLYRDAPVEKAQRLVASQETA